MCTTKITNGRRLYLFLTLFENMITIKFIVGIDD